MKMLSLIYSGNRLQNWSNKGFTLIEMMVVVAIVAILAAIGIPQYNKYMLNAKTTEAVTAMKQIADAMRAYYDAHGQYPTDTYNTCTREDYSVSDGTWGGSGYRAISNELPILDISSSKNWEFRMFVQNGVSVKPDMFLLQAIDVWITHGWMTHGKGRSLWYVNDLDALGVTSANKKFFDGNFYKAVILAPDDPNAVDDNQAIFNSILPNWKFN